jgi:hypothetical protein
MLRMYIVKSYFAIMKINLHFNMKLMEKRRFDVDCKN